MDLLLLPLSKRVHLIGLLRPQQSSSFVDADIALIYYGSIALAPSLNVRFFCDFPFISVINLKYCL